MKRFKPHQEEHEMLERMISQGMIPQDDYSKEERKLLIKAFFAFIYGQKGDLSYPGHSERYKYKDLTFKPDLKTEIDK